MIEINITLSSPGATDGIEQTKINPMKITLLTHPKERHRHHNTGQLLSDLPGCEVEIVQWQRTEPNAALVEALNSGTAILLSPNGQGQQRVDSNEIQHWVILDGTWQEARKMINRSDYLKTAQWFALAQNQSSAYTLRRNQVEGGLCTAECAIAVLQLAGLDNSAELLQQRFIAFCQ